MADANPTPTPDPAPTGPLPDSTPKNTKPMAEFTLQAVLLGIAIGIVMTAANVYLGLKAGMTVSASIPAAVISMGILRGLMKRGTILENNIVQTIGSAGESLAAGIIFTIPALVITGVWDNFQFWPTTLIAVLGGLLGVLFMIPVRRALIVEEEELTYPEGVACARVLEAGEEGGTGLFYIAGGLLVGLVVKYLVTGLHFLRDALTWSTHAGRTAFGIGCDVSPALLAVGYIVGFNVAVLVFIGGFIAWGIGIPCYILAEGMPEAESAYGAMEELWSTKIRFMGVGAMIVGGLWSIITVRHGIVKGIRGIIDAYQRSSAARQATLDGSDAGAEIPTTDQDLSLKAILGVLIPTLIGVFVVYGVLTGSFAIGATAALIMIFAAFFFVAVSSYIVGLVGSSNNPVSGMTISTMLLACLLLTAFQMTGPAGILASLCIAGVVCCAACTAGDVSQDLKTGHLVGATPRKQQIGQLIGVLSSAAIIAPVLMLLHSQYGIGMEVKEGVTPLGAPQASLFASIAQAFFDPEGAGLPWGLVQIGAAIAVVMIAIDCVLKEKKSTFRLYVMPVAVGIYLPWALGVPILLGGIASSIVKKIAPKGEKENANHRGVMICSGLIAGESIMGIIIALLLAVEFSPQLGELMPSAVHTGLSLLVFVMLFVGLIVAAKGRAKSESE
jgi:putative OPT family oligopeptide transporter